MFAEFCDSCGEPIGIDVGQMAHGSQHWHASERCFSCYNCGVSLLGQPFLPKNGEIFCSSGCSRGIPPPKPVNPKYPPRSASKHNRNSRKMEQMNSSRDSSSSVVSSPEPVKKITPEVRSKTSYRSSLDKYGLAAAERLGDVLKNVPHNDHIKEESDRDETSSTTSSLRKELPAFPPSNRHSKKPVLRVPPRKQKSKEIWIDMVPPKEVTTRQEHKNNNFSKYEEKHLNGNDTIERLVQAERQRRRHRKRYDDSYFSDFEVEKRKRSQRQRQYMPTIYTTEESPSPDIMPIITSKAKSTESLDAGKARLRNIIDDPDGGKRSRTRSESNLSGTKGYKSKTDAVANLRLGIDVSSPQHHNKRLHQKADLGKRAPPRLAAEFPQPEAGPSKPRSFGMFSAEDTRRTRIAYVTQDDMAIRSRQKSPKKSKRKSKGGSGQCTIS